MELMMLSLILLALVSVIHCEQSPASGGSTVDVLHSSFDYVMNMLGLSETCPYHDDVIGAVQRELPKRIKGQSEAVRLITNAVAAWEMQKASGKPRPLVLALTGSTGVGKSQTAKELANVMLARKSRKHGEKQLSPDGFVYIRGEDLSIEAGVTVQEAQAYIKRRLVDHFKKCGERGIIVFDEVQKVIPGTLDVILPALEENGHIVDFTSPSSTTDLNNPNKALQDSSNNRAYSTSECIFLFISDIGSDKLIKMLLKYGDRDLIPPTILRSEVKQSLDAQWNDLILGKMINEVVPYLPMEQKHVQEVIRLKVDELTATSKDEWWMDMVVDDDVIEHFSGKAYLYYVRWNVKNKGMSNMTSPMSTSKTASINANGEAEIDSNPTAAKASLNTHNGQSISPDSDTSLQNTESKGYKIVARHGTRSLEKGGPVQDLKSLLYTVMRPWRPLQVIHVGLVDPERHTFPDSMTSPQKSSRSLDTEQYKFVKKVYLQWCRVPLHYVHSHTNAAGRLYIEEEFAFSDSCETQFIGTIYDLNS